STQPQAGGRDDRLAGHAPGSGTDRRVLPRSEGDRLVNRACYDVSVAVSTAERRSPYRKGDEVTVTVDRMAYGGRGVGRVDGYVVFVSDTAPGDRVRARLWRVQSGSAVAGAVAGGSPSGLRTAPPCPHVGPG